MSTFLQLWPWLVLALCAVAAISAYLLRRRRDVWKRFARRHGLRVVEAPSFGAPRLEGTVEGRRIALYAEEGGSDTGDMGFEVVTFRMKLVGAVPAGLEVAPGGVRGEIEKLAGAADVELGDEKFDSAVRVDADDPERLAAYLTRRRRRAVLELLALPHIEEAGVAEGAVYVTQREMISDLENLERRFRELLSLARRLDGASA